MSKCSKCGTSINNEDAKFCDNCGEFLLLTGKEIKFKHNISNKRLNEFKKVLIESVDTIYDSHVDSMWYNETIISYLIELTTISSVFKREEINFIYINDILSLLKRRCDKELIVYEFLVKVNEFYEDKKSHEKKLFNVIVYTNVDTGLKKYDKFNELLEFFDLEIFDFNDYVFKENQDMYKNNFNSGFLMLKFSKKTRDSDLIKSQALMEVYSLFGYLTYLNKFNNTTDKYHINELSMINQVSDFECNALIVANEENEILQIDLQNEIITNSKNIFKSKINGIKSIELIKNFNVEGKMKISRNIKDYFHLYYLAAFESSLENSFLKFWSLSEKMIKDMYGDVKDSKLKGVMKTILKGNKYPKYIRIRIDFLYIKRNDFVHENKHGEITHYDQSLIKAISERLIDFLIYFLEDVENMKDYSVILEHINKNDDEKRRIIRLIERTMVRSYEFDLNEDILFIKRNKLFN